jgi:hypothetical protein
MDKQQDLWIGLRLTDKLKTSAWLIPPIYFENTSNALPELLRPQFSPEMMAGMTLEGICRDFQQIPDHDDKHFPNHFWTNRYEKGALPFLYWATISVTDCRDPGWGPKRSERFVHDRIMKAFPLCSAFLDIYHPPTQSPTITTSKATRLP